MLWRALLILLLCVTTADAARTVARDRTLDTFNRPNENPATGWTTAFGSGVKVENNILKPATLATHAANYSTPIGGPDVEVWATIAELPPAYTALEAHLATAASGFTTDHIEIEYGNALAGDGKSYGWIALWQYTDPAPGWARIGNGVIGLPPLKVGDIIKLKVYKGRAFAYINGALIDQGIYTTTNYTPGTYVGLYFDDNGGTAPGGAIDNFGAARANIRENARYRPSDTFDRPNEGPPPTGWTASYGSGHSINNGVLSPTTDNSDGTIFNIPTSGLNMEVYGIIVPGLESTAVVGQVSGPSGYAATGVEFGCGNYVEGSATLAYCYIWSAPDASTTYVYSLPALTPGEVIILRFKGNVATGYRNGSSVVTKIISTAGAGPYAGVYNDSGFNTVGFREWGVQPIGLRDNARKVVDDFNRPNESPTPSGWVAWGANPKLILSDGQLSGPQSGGGVDRLVYGMDPGTMEMTAGVTIKSTPQFTALHEIALGLDPATNKRIELETWYDETQQVSYLGIYAYDTDYIKLEYKEIDRLKIGDVVMLSIQDGIARGYVNGRVLIEKAIPTNIAYGTKVGVSVCCSINANGVKIDDFFMFKNSTRRNAKYPTLDSFTRPNEGPPMTGWVSVSSPGMKVLNGEATYADTTGPDAFDAAIWKIPSISPDMEAWGTIVKTDGFNGSHAIALQYPDFTAWPSTSGIEYGCGDGPNPTQCWLFAWPNDPFGEPYIWYVGRHLQPGDKLRARVVGNTAYAYFNDALVLTRTLTLPGTPGRYAGFYVYNGILASPGVEAFDNFGMQPITARKPVP